MDSPKTVTLPAVFDDLHVGITLHDPDDGSVLDGNKRLEELYGYSAAELRTMAVGDYTAPSTRFSQEKAVRLIRAAAAGDSQVFEWHVERSTGELLWVRVHLSATTIDGTPCVLSEIRDITEYRARERRLRLLSRIVRHNLRNEMTLLMGYADRLRAAIEKDSLEEEVETILDIATEVGTLSDSISQIEEIASPDATQRSPTNLPEVVESIVESAKTEYPNAEFTLDVDADVWVSADKGVHYAIEHAVENAIEHNDQDEPAVTVTVSDVPERNQGVVRIADDGPPIPDVEVEVLDEESETDSTYHGSGVGLWVMKWCLDSLGGSLSFDENDPRGNVVSLSLPRVDTIHDAS